jgi:hypothetical protein
MNDEYEYGTPIPPIEEPQGGKDKRIWIILAVILIVLCCCCVGIALIMYFVVGDQLMEFIYNYTWLPTGLNLL